MSCPRTSEGEQEIRRVMAGLAETDPAYAAMLSDLAVLKLNQGEVAIAQRMFDRIIALRSEHLMEDACPAPKINNEEPQSKHTALELDRAIAASPQPAHPAGTKSPPEARRAPHSAATSRPSSAVPGTKSPTTTSSSGTTTTNFTSTNTNNNNNNSNNTNACGIPNSGTSTSRPSSTSATSSTNPRAGQDFPSSRARGGVGGGGGGPAGAMAGGAAMFARALGGNRLPSARPRRNPSSETSGTEAAQPSPSAPPASLEPSTPSAPAAHAHIENHSVGRVPMETKPDMSSSRSSSSCPPSAAAPAAAAAAAVAAPAAVAQAEQKGLEAGPHLRSTKTTATASKGAEMAARVALAGLEGKVHHQRSETTTTAVAASREHSESSRERCCPQRWTSVGDVVVISNVRTRTSSSSRGDVSYTGCGNDVADRAMEAATEAATEAQDSADDGRELSSTMQVAATSGADDMEGLVTAHPARTYGEGSGDGGGGDNGRDSYLITAAAAVGTMTGKMSGWGTGCGSAAAAAATAVAAVSFGGSGSRSGTGRAAAGVKEVFLEPRGEHGVEDQDSGAAEAEAEAEAALRASLGECRHVLEVFGLTTEIRTSHLQEFVLELAFQEGRPLPVIKWVDDNHALLVCPDGATAMYLLQVDQDLFQLRPFAEASPASQAVAAADLLPPRERPKTTAAVAKRLLSHALGMSQLRDREAEKNLADQRKAAREARQERERKLAAAWDDD